MYILKRQGECGKQIDLVIIVVTWKKDTCYNIWVSILLQLTYNMI